MNWKNVVGYNGKYQINKKRKAKRRNSNATCCKDFSWTPSLSCVPYHKNGFQSNNRIIDIAYIKEKTWQINRRKIKKKICYKKMRMEKL